MSPASLPVKCPRFWVCLSASASPVYGVSPEVQRWEAVGKASVLTVTRGLRDTAPSQPALLGSAWDRPPSSALHEHCLPLEHTHHLASGQPRAAALPQGREEILLSAEEGAQGIWPRMGALLSCCFAVGVWHLEPKLSFCVSSPE